MRWCRRPGCTRADFGTNNGCFRHWFRCLPLCQRARLELAQALVPSSRDSLNSARFSDKPPLLAPRHRDTDFCQELTLDGRLAPGGGARNRGTWTIFVDPYETLCVAGLFSAEAIFASSSSKFGKFSPAIDREDLNSSTESTISTYLIHNIASEGKSEQVVYLCFESYLPAEKR